VDAIDAVDCVRLGKLGNAVLLEHGGKTTLTMTVLYQLREVRDAVLGTPMDEGMAAGFDRLAELLATNSTEPQHKKEKSPMIDEPQITDTRVGIHLHGGFRAHRDRQQKLPRPSCQGVEILFRCGQLKNNTSIYALCIP
jgi:hypothetical protein